jgi:hypothetical protein
MGQPIGNKLDLQAMRAARSAAHAARVRLAREDPNTFIEFVLRDEKTGKPVRQSALHEQWQRMVSVNKRVIVWAHVGSGKAVPLSTPIPTPCGWKTMGDLRLGDSVFASNGAPCTVVGATDVQLERDVYKVTFDDGDELLADADHLWLARSIDDLQGVPASSASGSFSGDGPLCACGCGLGVTRGANGWHRYVHNHHGRAKRTAAGFRVVTTLDMLRAGICRVAGAKRPDGSRSISYKWRIPVTAPVRYPDAVLPVHPYALGAWLGDGSIGCTDITFHVDDRFVYDRCVGLEGGELCPPRSTKDKPHILRGGIGVRPRLGQKHDGSSLLARLRALGVLHNKHIPDLYLTAAIEQRRELLGGLLDTDGTVNAEGVVELSLCNERLAFGALELIRSLGFRASCTPAPAVLYGRVVGTRWRIFFTPHVPVFFLPRKLARQILGEEGVLTKQRSITAITKVETCPVRCITVDSADSSYLMGKSYTVTHNTQNLAIGRVLWELGRDPTKRIAIMTRTEGLATSIVSTIGRILESSEELHEVFPGLARDRDGKWTEHQLTVTGRPVSMKEASVQAYGIESHAIQGRRLDLLVLDDILDRDNTASAAQMEDIWQWFHSIIEQRMTKEDQVICIGTAWHPEDFYHRLARQPRWVSGKFPVLDEHGQSTWPEMWPLSLIAQKRAALDAASPGEFARTYMCTPRDDRHERFKRGAIERCKERGEGRTLMHYEGTATETGDGLKKVPDGCRVYTGVDLAFSKSETADMSCLFTIIVWPDGTREVLDIQAGQWHGVELKKKILSAHARFHGIFVVENNGAQDLLVQDYERASYPFYNREK